jgi:hypothetical protein
MSSKPFIDIGHHLAEQRAVTGHIGRTENTYPIVDHLMDYGIVYLLLRHVKPAAYAYPEIRILQLTVPFAVLAVCAYAKVGLGIGNGYGRFREPTVKHTDVKLPELLLNVCYIRFHSIVSLFSDSM